MDRTIISFLFMALFSLIGKSVVYGANETVPASKTASPPAPTTAPILKYSCDTNGNVNLTMSELKNKNYTRIAIYGTASINLGEAGNSVNKSICKRDFDAVTSQDIQLRGCELKKPIYVFIMKEKLTNIFGGHEFHEYVIECSMNPAGVTKIASVKLEHESTPIPSRQTNSPSVSVTMTIEPHTNVIVGQRLFMEIRIDGNLQSSAGKLYVLPELCSATPGPNIQTVTPLPSTTSTVAPIQLLDTSSAEPLDQEIMEKFVIADNGSAITHVYAFRFMNSDEVTLQCTVHVCPDKSCNATFQKYASTPPTKANRKRRAIEQYAQRPQTRVVKAIFTVKDTQTTSGKTAVGDDTFVFTVFLLVTSVVLRL